MAIPIGITIGLIQRLYKAILRPIVKRVIDRPNSVWDDWVLAILDIVFGYGPVELPAGDEVLSIFKDAYGALLRPVILVAVDDADETWDDILMGTLDRVFGYKP